MSLAIKLHIKEGIVFKKKEILEMIKISSEKKYNDCYISLYYNITIVIFKCFDD